MATLSRSRYQHKIGRQHGAVLVLTIVALVALLAVAALVVDVGRLRMARQRAQNVADAAAIGGAQELTGLAGSDITAVDTAQALALANNVSAQNWSLIDDNGNPGVTAVPIPEGENVTLGDGSTIKVGLNQALRVHGRVNVNYAFAPAVSALLGHTGDAASGAPGASAIAMWVGVRNLKDNLTPWVMPPADIWTTPGVDPVVGREIVIKVNDIKDSFTGHGNFQAVKFAEDTGGNDYRNRIGGTLTTPVTIKIGDLLDMEQGNVVGPTNQGVKERLGRSAFPTTTTSCAYNAWLAKGCPDDARAVVVPVVEYPVTTGKQLKVIGFSAFFICGYADGGQVTGHFVTARLDGGKLVFGGTNLSNTGAFSLISTIRLVM